mgnify:FL=1
MIGCGEVEHYDTTTTNLDSLFKIGDSVLTDLYVQQAQQRIHHDSLQGEVSSYQIRLSAKQIKEQRERIIYKDTIIYRQKVKTITDTIFNKVYLTDTIRDTIFVTIKKERKKKSK